MEGPWQQRGGWRVPGAGGRGWWPWVGDGPCADRLRSCGAAEAPCAPSPPIPHRLPGRD